MSHDCLRSRVSDPDVHSTKVQTCLVQRGLVVENREAAWKNSYCAVLCISITSSNTLTQLDSALPQAKTRKDGKYAKTVSAFGKALRLPRRSWELLCRVDVPGRHNLGISCLISIAQV